MTRQEAVAHLRVLEESVPGTFVIRCRAVHVIVRVHTSAEPIIVGCRDGITLRSTDEGLVIASVTTGTSRLIAWDDIVSMAVGEPETSDGHLSQG